MNKQHSFWALLLALAVVAGTSCDKPKPETLVEGGYDEAEMEAAIARARSEVDRFIEELEKGDGSDFAVKAPIEENGKVEHFWLTDVVYRDGKFEGLIGNDPGIVSHVKLEQDWTIEKSEISDWMFMRDGKMYGNYTMRPLLKTLSPEEAAQFRSILAEP